MNFGGILVKMVRLKTFIRNETVLVIAALLSVLSMFYVRPGSEYIEYIDFSVLGILFCLMAVVAGFQRIGVFEALSVAILSKTGNGRVISVMLVLVCFFAAMFITNDVALITFVPFTLGILGEDDDNLIFVIVMETIAANLGSMMTPIGNPQNLFLYSYYGLNIIDFLKVMAPPCAFSFILIMGIMIFRKRGSLAVKISKKSTSIDRVQLLKYSTLFLICILTVLHVINYIVCFAVITAVLLISDRSIFKEVDYMLLLTFVCFFIFVGNMSSLEITKHFIGQALSGREILFSAVLSQGISNVPAAVMLAPFTDRAAELLIGVNIGGLGTLVASMASLISYKYYGMRSQGRRGKYLWVFSIYNFGLLAMLLLGVHFL